MDKKLLFLSAVVGFGLVSCFDSPGGGGDSEEADESPSKKTTKEVASTSPAELKDDIEKTKKRNEGLEKRLAGLNRTLAKLQGRNSDSDEDEEKGPDVSSPEGYLRMLDEMDEYYDSELVLWREATRSSFSGIKLPEVTTTGGENYKQVEILSVGEKTLDISHAGGTTSLSIVDLPEKLRMNLIHEPTVLLNRN